MLYECCIRLYKTRGKTTTLLSVIIIIMLILMAVTLLKRSPLRHWAYLTHQLASSCVISVGRYLRTQGKSEKRAFCFKDARCTCNVLMPYCSTTVYLLMTAPIDFSYTYFRIFSSNFLNLLGIICTDG